MKNIGFVSHDEAVRSMIMQLKDRDANYNFYEIDDDLTVIDQYEITHVVFDFNNFESFEDLLLYQRLNERSEMRFLIIGNEISALLHNDLKNYKVVAHLLKPVSAESMAAAVKFYLLDQKIILNKDEQGDNLLFGSRIYSCLLGYYFLNKAVQYCRDNHVDKSVRMAVIYDYIAVNYHTTKSNVEKSIRRLIVTYENDQHRTNSEMILYFYEKLRAKHLELTQ